VRLACAPFRDSDAGLVLVLRAAPRLRALSVAAAPLVTGAFAAELDATAAALCSRGKGLLAADESTGTAGARLQSVGVPNSEEARRALRQLLFTTPGIEAHVSGVVRAAGRMRSPTW
jgi:hypothetical protein